MSLRERLGWAILGSREQSKLAEAANVLAEAIRLGPLTLPPETMIQRLGELDSRYLDFLTRYLQTNTALMEYEETENDRIRLVHTSRRMYANDVLTEAIIDIWTDFGFGLNVSVIPVDEAAAEVWNEFWTAGRNQFILSQRIIHDLSRRLLVDGDFLFMFFTDKLTGQTTVRIIDTLQIRGGENNSGIVTLKDDATVPVLYRRESSNPNTGETTVRYYIDWRATDDDLSAVSRPGDGEIYLGDDGTEVRAMLVAHRQRGRHRGYPLMAVGFPWSVAYRDFLQDRASVARAVAMYVDKLTVKGGQRAVDTIAARLQSALAGGAASETNPRPTAGATWLQNEAVDRERMPLTTGAGDANIDGASLLAQAALAGRLYPHWVGRGEAFRLATATSMERPLLRAFNRYQLFWSSVWQDMAAHILTMRERYGPRILLPDKDVNVTTDSVIDIAINDITAAGNMLANLFDRGLVSPGEAEDITQELLRVILQTVGVSNLEQIFNQVSDEQQQEISDDIPAPLQDLLKKWKSAPPGR